MLSIEKPCAVAVLPLLFWGLFGTGTLSAHGNLANKLEQHCMTPWVWDAARVKRGEETQLDWSAPGAPDLRSTVEVAAGGRPVLSGPEIVLELDHVLLHYTKEGKDAVTDEQVAWAVDAIAWAWQLEVDTLGYPPPVPDAGVGGDDRYDFYYKIQSALGTTYFDTAIDSTTASSWIEISSALQEPGVQLAVAHEFFHSIHYTMDYNEEVWWVETTATWMEDIAYDDINDYYGFLPATFSQPELPITSPDTMYANAIYVRSLSEHFGVDIVKDIWFATSLSDEPQALEFNSTVVEQHGESWQWTIQNYRESMFDLTRFEEGEGYAETAGEVDMSGRVEVYAVSASGTIKWTGAHLLELVPPDGYGTLTIDLTGDTDMVASLLMEDIHGYIKEVVTDTPVSDQVVSFAVPDFGNRWDRGVLVVTNTGLSSEKSYNAIIDVTDWTDDSGCAASVAPAGKGNRTSWPSTLVLLTGLFGIRLRRRLARVPRAVHND